MSLLNPNDPFNPSESNLARESQRVVVTDIDMTIGDMCRFMVKWAIAAIPAIVILFVVWFVMMLITVAIFHSGHNAYRPLANQLSAPPPPPSPQQ